MCIPMLDVTGRGFMERGLNKCAYIRFPNTVPRILLSLPNQSDGGIGGYKYSPKNEAQSRKHEDP